MQRIILRQLKQSVHQLQGSTPPDLNTYYQAYKREFRSYEKISTKSELLRAVRSADVVFGADFHPFLQSQRTHLRILRDLIKHRPTTLLALEAIDAKHQEFLDQFLKGKIPESSFLKKINFQKTWGFPWENYKVFFDFARQNKIAIYGLNDSALDRQSRSLKERDAFSAKRIAELVEDNPESSIYVIYGDLHLAKSHLPKITKQHLKGRDVKFVTLFQDSETLYWRLAKRGLEEKVDVLKLRTDAYCVVNSPPWIKWQSYLNFLERSLDTDEVDKNPDYSDHLGHFIELLQKVWKVTVRQGDFTVFGRGDVKMAPLILKSFSKLDAGRVLSLVKLGRFFYIPLPSIFFVPHFDLNPLVSLAGQYVHAKLRHEKKVHMTFPKDFVPAIWIEAIGFFSSLINNNRRKSHSLKNVTSTHHAATLIALEQRLREQMAVKTGRPLQVPRRHYKRKSDDFYTASRMVGSILGSRLYENYQKGDVPQEQLQTWLKRSVQAGTSFNNFYVSVLRQLRMAHLKENQRDERL